VAPGVALLPGTVGAGGAGRKHRMRVAFDA
jgi:hypothetical protein